MAARHKSAKAEPGARFSKACRIGDESLVHKLLALENDRRIDVHTSQVSPALDALTLCAVRCAAWGGVPSPGGGAQCLRGSAA